MKVQYVQLTVHTTVFFVLFFMSNVFVCIVSVSMKHSFCSGYAPLRFEEKLQGAVFWTTGMYNKLDVPYELSLSVMLEVFDEENNSLNL